MLLLSLLWFLFQGSSGGVGCGCLICAPVYAVSQVVCVDERLVPPPCLI